MSAREWQQGDLALVASLSGAYRLARRGEVQKGAPYWWFIDSNTWTDSTDARPVVVIDPKDRKAARRLLEVFGRQFTDWTPELDSNVTRLQDALHIIANPTPPKPDEPTGLGAVVEDAEGNDWHRTREGRWIAVDGLRSRACGWDYIAAVRVLSEGVTP